MPADTYEEKHWYTGKLRTRCRDCGKVVFPDEETAQSRAALISERTPMIHYQGACGHWHVSRKRSPRNGQGLGSRRRRRARRTGKPSTPNY